MSGQDPLCIRFKGNNLLYIVHNSFHNIGQFNELNDRARLSHVKLQAMLHYVILMNIHDISHDTSKTKKFQKAFIQDSMRYL